MKYQADPDPIDYALEVVTAAQIEATAGEKIATEDPILRLHKEVGVYLPLGLTILCGQLLHRLKGATGEEPLDVLRDIAAREHRDRFYDDDD